MLKNLSALLLITAFGLQSCSPAVSPTSNAKSINDNSTLDDIEKTTKDTLCLAAGDKDSDGDGVCDGDDKTDTGYDCSQDPKCLDGEHGDEYVTPEKSKWWIPVGAIAVAGAGATLVLHAKSGDWWWDDLLKGKPDADSNDMFTMAKDEKGDIKVWSQEKFFLQDGQLRNLFILQYTSAHGFDFEPYGGGKIAKGHDVVLCINSAFGFSTLSGLTSKATYYLGDYQKKEFTDALKDVKRTLPNFLNYCEERNGAFLALEDNQNDVYNVSAYPSRLLNSSKLEDLNNPGMDVNYVFESIPSHLADKDAEISYNRQNPNSPLSQSIHMRTSFKDLATDAAQQTKLDHYNGCADNTCRVQTFFGQVSTLPPTITAPVKTEINTNITDYKSVLPTYTSTFSNSLRIPLINSLCYSKWYKFENEAECASVNWADAH